MTHRLMVTEGIGVGEDMETRVTQALLTLPNLLT